MTEEPVQIADNPTGMDAVRAALSQNKAGQRSIAWLAKEIGVSRGAVLQWDKVPEERIEQVSKVTGISPRVLRPDLAELFAESVGG